LCLVHIFVQISLLMNQPTIIEDDYLGALLQWVVFFGFVSILILPALLYKKVAKKFNKKGWLYFIIGLVVGFIGLSVVQLYARVVKQLASPDNFQADRYYWLVSMYVVGYLYVWLAYKVLLAFTGDRKSQ
jgi:hypothetical protein